MLIAVTTQRGSAAVEVRIIGVADDEASDESEAHSDVEPKDGPSPIAPELKELVWGAGAFVVFAVLMRLVLYPRMRKGMDARYASIRTGHEDADATRLAAQTEVSEYQTQLAALRAEAAARVDVARQTLEAERQDRLTEANARIAERRAEAAATVEAAHEAARAQIEEAVAGLVSNITELATGRQPDSAVVSGAVASAMSAGVAR
ncbi:MAG TPA: ATP synthase F0 subunit B [Ilumatobacteraceae bacterium]|nr:ATP synthase F0 subunit B [Ilumatobacteraceae bacterium]